MTNVKKVIAVLVMGFSVSTAANATDGTISFNGTISSVTCSINGSTPNGAANMTVGLPTVDASALTSAGAIAGTTPFQIVLGKSGEATCNNGSIAKVQFETGAGVDTATGMLNNTASNAPAGNVKVAVLNADDFSQIMVGSASPNNHASATIAANQGTLNYIAAYKAPTGGATAGAVTASVAYSVVYN